jgi:hypothetical protein
MNKSDTSSHDSDSYENQQTVTRIFHGLYVVDSDYFEDHHHYTELYH